MIKADDLVRWIREHAVGKSITVLGGWIKGSDLLSLAQKVNDKEPFDFLPRADDDSK